MGERMFHGGLMKAGVAVLMLAACAGAFAQTTAPVAKAAPRPVMVNHESMKNLFAAAIKRGNEFWKDGFWVDHRDMYCGGAHTTTMLYYVLAYTKLSNGDRTFVDRVEKHYAWMRKQYWLEREHCWRDPHDVMMNACLAMNVSMALQIGAEFLSPETRAIMEKDLRDTCVYLSKNNTAVLNNDDLRACNQDAISAAALAVSSQHLKDPSIRSMAAEKLALILKRSEGPFWIEGGVDKDYQSVGDSAIGVVADILWDELTLAQKQRIAELLTRPYATAQLGIEKMRSESTLGFSGEGSQSSAILARVANPLIAADVLHAFRARQSMRNPWWIFETPAALFYWGLLRSADALGAMPESNSAIGWGGSARLGMKIDEFQSRNGSVDEKTYLTTDEGLAVLFGDVSGWNPQYAYKKRYVEKLQEQLNPGGLRYISRGRKVFAWAEGRYDYPRLVFGKGPAEQNAPERHCSFARVGFVGGQYHLDQVLRDAGKAWAGSVAQDYVVLGRSLLIRMSADDKARKLADLRYELTVPAQTARVSGASVRWTQGSLWEKDSPSEQMLRVVQGSAPRFEADQLKAFIANERIRHWIADKGGSFVWAKPEMPLSRVQVPLGNGPAWAVLSVDGTAGELDQLATSMTFESDAGVETLSFMQGGRWYGVVYLAEKTKRDEVAIDSPAGRITLKKPVMGVVQSFVIDGQELTGYFANAAGLAVSGRHVFMAAAMDKPAQVSGIKSGGMMYVDVSGGARLGMDGTAKSLITGQSVELKSIVEQDRFWVAVNQTR